MNRPSAWVPDLDDPDERAQLAPRCPECGFPALQIALWISEAREDEWQCGDCGQSFREPGHPIDRTWLDYDGEPDEDDELDPGD